MSRGGARYRLAGRGRSTAEQLPIEQLPDECLVYLMGSRYCETDKLTELAWSLFKDTRPGWKRVQAICDYVHNHLTFGYHFAAPTKTAHSVHKERQGVCRDFAHLAVTLCRCMNIPTRYCTGYLGDIGVPPDECSDGFFGLVRGLSVRQLVYLRSRHNIPRIGRILVGRGRDAADVPLSNSFGHTTLTKFQVYTDEVV